MDVICAYLRMPYTPPPPETPQVGTHYGDRAHGAADSPSSTITTSQSEATPTDQHQQSRQEREVRLTAQGILARNLRLPTRAAAGGGPRGGFTANRRGRESD